MVRFLLRFLALLLLVALGAVAWIYRREIRRAVHEWTRETPGSVAMGRPDAARLRAVRRRIDSLGVRGRDSVVLQAEEIASVIALLGEQAVPGAVDSLTVRLGRDDIEVSGVLDLRRVPGGGPDLPGLRDRERFTAAGPLLLRRAGRAEWQVERARVRGLPVPLRALDGLFRRISGTPGTRSVPFPVPATVTGLRVTGAGVTLYGTGER